VTQGEKTAQKGNKQHHSNYPIPGRRARRQALWDSNINSITREVKNKGS